MKVCTDACLFAALLPPAHLATGSAEDKKEYKVLDIGTGTGLLSLMFSQKNPDAVIDAVEIDADAARQAKQNFEASPWKERLKVFNVDIISFRPDKKYDLVISNPPFFEGDLLSLDKTKNNAKHNSTLSFTALLQATEKLLNTDGAFAVLLPYHRVNYFIEEAGKTGLYLTKQVLVKQTENHHYFRGILFFSRKKNYAKKTDIVIKDSKDRYSARFTKALRDYYLYLD